CGRSHSHPGAPRPRGAGGQRARRVFPRRGCGPARRACGSPPPRTTRGTGRRHRRWLPAHGAVRTIRRRILPVPEELVVLLLSNPALLEEELRELLRDLPGAVLDVALDGLRERAGRSDSPGHRHVRRRQPCRRADPGHWSESRLPRALEALEWLTRKLDDAAFQFIREAKSGDQLLCCFYEFRYRPVADE